MNNRKNGEKAADNFKFFIGATQEYFYNPLDPT
jgi:hypothetical protein